MAAHSTSRQILRLARLRTERALGDAARRAGYEFRRRHFYLPFPDADRLAESLWLQPRSMPGVKLDVDGCIALFRSLAPHIGEFASTGFPVPNGSYEWGDAETLYGMLRFLRPTRVIELGSGASSHLIAHAQTINKSEGNPFTFESYDPFPGWHPMGQVNGVTTHRIATENLKPTAVEVLEADDVLFVDTTHTVRTGGDVTHIILELLPRLAQGVYIHFHDIFLPFEYPREWVVEERRAWAEQYLLQAFLAFNAQFEVVLPVHALFRQRPEIVGDVIPSLVGLLGIGPGAFWLRRC
jgi:hypothetical protein